MNGQQIGAAALLLLAGWSALLWQRKKLPGTTLLAPWVWCVVSLSTLGVIELAVALAAPAGASWAGPLRYAAAMSTFCPAMALFGAKRPQDRGWQWIVLSLWTILCLPSVEWLLYGGQAEIHPARFWFLVILVAAAALNGIGTRYWPASLLFCAAQVAMISPFAGGAATLAGVPLALWGLAALVVSWLLVAIEFPRATPPHSRLDRAWLDFRDAFGVVWSLRVMERINASAQMYDWPVTLCWCGFVTRQGAPAGDVSDAVEQSLRALLRRFVSPQWIDERVSQQTPDASVAAP